MMFNFKIVRVDSDYCDYLRQFDTKVAYNRNEKNTRPFVGVLFEINSCEYFAPLSIPKLKHQKMKNTIDFLKLKDGELGAINFNNMIPVKENNYCLVDLSNKQSTVKEARYQKLLKEQLAWLNANYNQVKNKSMKLYKLYTEGRLNQSINNRCCNFKLLEEKCKKYSKITK